MQTITRLI